ncbi:MAG: Ig-like domain-containing protein, partial [Candidatus Promineifilaceae bacterium]|nr:Ig-like domain-containing protein [Candidatus Promineifilaceae bacterium]
MSTRIRALLANRTALLVGAGLLFVAVLAGGIFVILGDEGDGNDEQTNPTLVDGQGGGQETVIVETSGSVPVAGGRDAQNDNLSIRLSQGQAQPQVREPLALTSGEPLSDQEIEALLARLPELIGETEDEQAFNLPAESPPPPRPGETVSETFPPSEAESGPAEVPSGPLEIVRFSPEGAVPLAPVVSVTFNQPMVPLTSLAELATEEVPVQMEPTVPGSWQWLGTKTVTFEPSLNDVDRLPMATEYRLTVPAGVTASSGASLAESVSWAFSTPPPTLMDTYPRSGPQSLEPLIFASFDQRIDPTAVLNSVRVTADGVVVDVRLASADAIAADETVSRLADHAAEGRWLAFSPTNPLPPDADIVVTFGPGTPSAEGPLTTTEAQSFNFRTYAALAVDSHGCQGSRQDCRPLMPFFIHFNNPLDLEAYQESFIQIEPGLPNATVNIFGNTVRIDAATSGSTTYRVTLEPELLDIFGQTLGRRETLSFRVGSADPVLVGPDTSLVTLDPAAEQPTFTVYSINYERLNVKAYRVQPSDWPAYKRYLQNYYQEERRPTPPGELVLDETVATDSQQDALTETNIPLAEALEDGPGHLIVMVEPPAGLFQRDRGRPVVQAWVQATRIGLDTLVDHSEMLVWATDLANGQPLPGAAIRPLPETTEQITDNNGVVRFGLPPGGVQALVAQLDGDSALLPAGTHVWDDSRWQTGSVRDLLQWYVFDDRQMYRPGEQVHLKGWLRVVGQTQQGDVRLPAQALTVLNYLVIDPQGNELAAGEVEVNRLGGFDLAFTIPDPVNLGFAQVRLSPRGGVSELANTTHHHAFQIQEFRRPEFEVSVRNETNGPHFVGQHAVVSVSADYFAGGPLPNAEVFWRVGSTPASYSPPNWPDFVFGEWTPWWIGESFYFEGPIGPESGPTEWETFNGFTDASGKHYLRLDFEASEALARRPFSVRAVAEVMDVNRQAWSDQTDLLVHPAGSYVGLRSQNTFVRQGEALDVDVIVTDLDGQVLVGRTVTLEAARLVWQYGRGGWNEEPGDIQTCTLESADEPLPCSFSTEAGGGRYQITAVVTDEAGRQNQTRLVRWVSGGQRPPARQVEREALTLVPNQETYQPGETARILVQAPFAPAEGLLTVDRGGLLYSEQFTLPEGSATLEIPIREEHIPNLNVQIEVVGSAPRTDDNGETLDGIPPRAADSTGPKTQSLAPAQRAQELTASPTQAPHCPGAET